MKPIVVLQQGRTVSILFLLTMLLPCVPAQGMDEHGMNEPRLDLPSLIQELEQVNPEIKASRQRWEAATAVVPQVQTLPDPKVQFGYQRMPMMEPVQGAMYGIGQEIPFPGKLQTATIGSKAEILS